MLKETWWNWKSHLKSIYQNLCLGRVYDVLQMQNTLFRPNMAPSSFPIRSQTPNRSVTYGSYREDQGTITTKGHNRNTNVRSRNRLLKTMHSSRVPTFQNFSTPGGEETNSQEPTMQVLHFKKSELQAMQLDPRPTGPLPHIPFPTKLAVFIDKEYPLPPYSVERINHCSHREEA